MTGHRVAFIGASGRIGQFCQAAKRLSDAIEPDYVWQYRSTPFETGPQFCWADFANPKPFLEAYEAHGFSTVVVLSGAAGRLDKSSPEAMSPNVRLVEQVLQAVHQTDISRVLVASSSAVYGAGTGVPFSETAALAPVNAYGQSKIEMEHKCQSYRRGGGPEICCLRIGNVAGADMLLTNAVTAKADNSEVVLDIFPDQDGPRRSYIGPQKFAQIVSCLSLYQGRLPEVLNLATTHPVAMNDLLDQAAVPWTPKQRPDNGHQDIVLNCDLLQGICEGIDLFQSPADIVADWRGVSVSK